MAHQVADLFEPEPAKWGLRGDPHVWRALRAHLADTQLPATAGLVALRSSPGANSLAAGGGAG